MIALDRQCVRAQIRHSLHHYWLLEGVLSGFNLGGESLGDWQEWPFTMYKCVAKTVLISFIFGPFGYEWFAPLVLKGLTGNTLQSDEDKLKLNELMELCTNLQKKILDLEKTKDTQANEIASLKRRAKKLEKKRSSRTHKLKRLYKVGLSARVESSGDEESLGEDAFKQGRINAIDADEDITLVNIQNVDEEMFDVDALDSEEVFIAGQNENVVEEVVDAAQVSIATTTITITIEEITLAQALATLKSSEPKVKGIAFQEPSTTTTTTISSQQSQDKGKGIMIEEHVKPMKKKVQIMLDEEIALKLQAEFDEEERLAREKAEK
ncbi:hypothetical protein Tco_1514398 [Tanacetum coccineum]